jgi:hypothetical protein
MKLMKLKVVRPHIIFNQTRGGSVKLVITWWNCRLSPPAKAAKKFPITKDFDKTIISLIQDHDTDILCLCEIDQLDIEHLETLLKTVIDPHHKLLNLYKNGRSIDDFCLIYNTRKLQISNNKIEANIRDETYGMWLKAGVFVGFEIITYGPLFIGLSHWQMPSHNTS